MKPCTPADSSMNRLSHFITVKSHKIRTVAREKESTPSSLLYASPKNRVEPDKANDGRRTTSNFQKQLKLMLYPQTCVPLCQCKGKSSTFKKLLVQQVTLE